MGKLVKIYAVTFLKYTNCLNTTVWDEDHDLAKYKLYGGGYRSIDYVGNIFEENMIIKG